MNPEPQRESDLDERIKKYISRLRLYAREGHEDRAALAALRSGLRGKPEQAHAAHRYVTPFLGQEKERRDDWFYLVGALFAWHPRPGRNRSLGDSFRQMREGGASDSSEARFAALLACDERDLHLHLRQAVGLLRAKDIPVDWHALLRDLALGQGWRHHDRRVQLRWARDYYRTSALGAGQDEPEQPAQVLAAAS